MPEPDVLALCEQLDGLRAAATPGPWRWDGDRFEASVWAGPETPREAVPVCASPDQGPVDATDAALIVAAVNAIEPLTAAVRGLLADRDTLARVAALAEEMKEAAEDASRRASEFPVSEYGTGVADTLFATTDRLRRILRGAS